MKLEHGFNVIEPSTEGHATSWVTCELKINEWRKKMNDTVIDYHIVFDDATEDYAEHSRKIARELSTQPDKLFFFKHEPEGGGSTGHAKGLNRALHTSDPTHINVIADSDTVLLVKGWDNIIREMMLHFSVVGTPYEDIGGACSGHGRGQTYKKLPGFVFFAAAPGCPIKSLDTEPNKQMPIYINDMKLSNRYNLPVGYTLFCDVGWRLPEWLEDRQLTHYEFNNLRLKDMPGCNECDIANELYSFKTQVPNTALPPVIPFIAHQRSGRSTPYMQGASKKFYDAAQTVFDTCQYT